MRVTNVYAIHPNNVGDIASSPLLYFAFPFPVDRHSIDRPAAAFEHVIFGGGGLQFFAQVERICRLATGRVISWGMGHNAHGGRGIRWPAYMDRFALHGIRDWGAGFPWVPCASCMHPVFDLEHPVRHDVVVYEHREFRLNIPHLPTMTNAVSTMDEAVRFLGSGETIVTSSYHGAYWGVLLGRRVVVVAPFSSKFYHFRRQPALSTRAEWRSCAKAAPVFPEALAECRAANRDHFANVCALF
jgi:hypothetical protein